MFLFYALLVILLLVDYVGLTSIKGSIEYRRKEKRSLREKTSFVIEDFFLIVLPIIFTVTLTVFIVLIETEKINKIII